METALHYASYTCRCVALCGSYSGHITKHAVVDWLAREHKSLSTRNGLTTSTIKSDICCLSPTNTVVLHKSVYSTKLDAALLTF